MNKERLTQILSAIDFDSQNIEAIKLRNEMLIHTRSIGLDCELLKARPNEPPHIKDYRLSIIEKITLPSINKGINGISKIFSKSVFSYTINNNDCLGYIESKNFSNKTIFNYLKENFIRFMIEDPNGLLLVLPIITPDLTANQVVYPKFELITCEQIIYYGEVLVYKVGEQMYYLTDTEYGKINIYDKKVIITLVYKHDIGIIPAVEIGGDYITESLKYSFFYPFVPYGNQAIRQFSDWQSLTTVASNPITEEFHGVADTAEIERKNINEAEGENDITKFSIKEGVKPFSRSPHSTIVRTFGTNGAFNNELDPSIPSVRFINPDIVYVQNAYETFDKLIKKAEQSIFITNDTLGISGEAKKVEKEAYYDFIDRIMVSISDSYKNILELICSYIEFKPFKDININFRYPQSVYLKSDADLIADVENAEKAGINIIKNEATNKLISVYSDNNEYFLKTQSILNEFDLLSIYDLTTKQNLFMQGLISKENLLNSVYGIQALNKIKYLKGALYLELENRVIWDMAKEIIKEFGDIEDIEPKEAEETE